jgi:hypothetical protein
MGTVKPIAACSHTGTAHLFQAPCCKTMSLLKRIAIVAFHILTIGIPLFIYKIISCCFPRKFHTQLQDGKKLQQLAVESVKPLTPAEAALSAWSKFKSSQDNGDLKSAFEMTAKLVLPIENELERNEITGVFRKLMKEDHFDAELIQATSALTEDQIEVLLNTSIEDIESAPDLSKRCVLLFRLIQTGDVENKDALVEHMFTQLDLAEKSMHELVNHFRLCDSSDEEWKNAVVKLTAGCIAYILTKSEDQQQLFKKRVCGLKVPIHEILSSDDYKGLREQYDDIALLHETPVKVKKPQSSPVPAFGSPSETVKAQRRFSMLPPAQVDPIVNAAKAFAEAELEKFINASPQKEPVPTGILEIRRSLVDDLSHIMRLPKAFEKELNAKLKVHGKKAWENEEVLKAADDLMKVAFYKASKALDDMRLLLFQFSQKKRHPTYTEEQFLSNERSYQFEAFEQFTYVYHSIRAGKYWTTAKLKDVRHNKTNSYKCWAYPKDFDADDFYKEGTKQHEWRMLFNSYRERLAKDGKLGLLTEWHQHRTEEDFSKDSFCSIPYLPLESENNAIAVFSTNPETINFKIAAERHAHALELVKETQENAQELGILGLHTFTRDKKATIGFRIEP